MKLMSNDKERVLISPCGLYCGSCALYKARTDEALREKIAVRQGITAAKVQVCAGCRPSKGMVSVSGGDPVCDTYTCTVNDKRVEFCYECEGFPCLKLAPCADRAREIPHNIKVYNLILLQKLDIGIWLENYESLLRLYRQGKKPKAGGDIQL